MPGDLLAPPSAPAVAPLLVSPRDAARMLAISERTLWTLTRRGELRAVRIGRAVRYSVDDLRRWIDAQQGVTR